MQSTFSATGGVPGKIHKERKLSRGKIKESLSIDNIETESSEDIMQKEMSEVVPDEPGVNVE